MLSTMKFNKLGLLVLFLGVNFLSAQVKIGANPDTIDPASMIELESTTKALVLSRMSNSQMQTVSPLRGALVYNTDTQCIHYYDGTQWNNLCTQSSSKGAVSFTDLGNGRFVLNDGNGGNISFYGAKETTSTLVDNFDGTYTYTNESGNQTVISFTAGDSQNLESATIDSNDILTLAIENGNSTSVDLSAYVDTDTHADQTEIEGMGFVTGAHTVDTNLSKTDIETMGFVDGAHTIDTDTHADQTEIEGMGFVTGAHTIDTDTQLSKTDIETMGFVDGAHTVDTDTHADQTEIEGMGFVTGAHTVDTNLSKTDIETMGFVDGAHTIDTDTHADQTEIEGMGFVTGAHTVDTNTQLSKTDIETMGFVDGAHTIDTDTHADQTEIEGMGFVTGAHTVDTNLSKTDIETMGFVDGSHTIDTHADQTEI
ncbi:hypothetical protein SAMN04488514_1311, partial [Kriegella aquimaris]